MDEFGGSVGGGGRYDKMIGKFTGQDTPAVGFSSGLSGRHAAVGTGIRSADEQTEKSVSDREKTSAGETSGGA